MKKKQTFLQKHIGQYINWKPSNKLLSKLVIMEQDKLQDWDTHNRFTMQ